MGKVIAASLLILALARGIGTASGAEAWNTIMEETWSYDRPGALAHELVSWKKLTGFESGFAKLVEENNKVVLSFTPEGVAAPLITKEQYAVSPAIKLEVQIRRLSAQGSWIRISILSAASRDVGYFVQVYANKVELVRTSGEDARQLGIREFKMDYPKKEPFTVALEIDPSENTVSVSLDGEQLIEAVDSPLLALDSGIMIGLRAQPGIQSEIHAIKLSSR